MGISTTRFAVAALAILSLVTVALLERQAAAQQTVTAEHFVVVTGHPDATRAALAVLEAGGNVMDAAVTASLAVGVAEPYGSGLGGKLMLLYRDGKTGQISTVEAMCAAPGKLDPAKFAKLRSRQRYFGYTSVAVPGLVSGLYAAHEKWGSRPWKELVIPAAELAERGIAITEKSRAFFRAKTKQLSTDPESARLYLVDGKTPAVGDVLKNADLGHSLRLVADGGPRAFYEGEIAERIVSAAQAAGAPLSRDDFRNFEPRWKEPLTIHYNGYEVYSCPPPLTGGVTVLTSLRALEHLDPLDARGARSGHYIDQVGRVLLELYPLVTDQVADTPESFAAAQTAWGQVVARDRRSIAHRRSEQSIWQCDSRRRDRGDGG